jgi:hypothetical protein
MGKILQTLQRGFGTRVSALPRAAGSWLKRKSGYYPFCSNHGRAAEFPSDLSLNSNKV